ncbi:M48 family metalloprotease [Marinoscillum pacificum]|uniref:M48 family metalloprotease n=1 Tax=Marinoscillum pacificum TaxID=392723 RepID=UPI00215727BC|nr:M48 family metalloprotease [Marinoscillum pacificum]
MAQFIDRPANLTPRYSGDDTELVDQIFHNAEREIAKLDQQTLFYKSFILDTRDYILDNVENGFYLKHDSLSLLVNELAAGILDANQLHLDDPIFFIKSSAFVNAGSLMINVFEIDVALFATLDSKDELAFVLAHELAHQLKYHVAERIVLNMEYDPEGKLRSEMQRVVKGVTSNERLSEAQEAMYEYRNSMRRMELQADSLATIYMRKAGYDPAEGMQVLNKLGYSACTSEVAMERLFLRLFTSRFKPKPQWFVKSLPMQSKQQSQFLIYKTDSLESHPHLEARVKALELIVQDSVSTNELKVNDVWREVIWSGYEQRQFDLTLFYLLIYIDQTGHDSFSGTMVGLLLNDLYWARYDDNPENNIYQYVSYRTPGYTEELRFVNNVLHHMTKEDYLMTGFMLLSNREVFDRTNEEHYYLLYHFASLLQENAIADQLKIMYFKQFEQTKYKTRDFK